MTVVVSLKWELLNETKTINKKEIIYVKYKTNIKDNDKDFSFINIFTMFGCSTLGIFIAQNYFLKKRYS